jgi:PAS domain S-box-containing protein
MSFKDMVITAEEEGKMQSFDSKPIGTVYRTVKDIQAGILNFGYVCGRWEKLTGVTAEETLADLKNFFVNVSSEDQKLLMQNINELDESNFEIRYHHPVTKKTRWFQILSFPRREGNQIIGDGILLDITARKKAEQKLLAEKERLENELETKKKHLQMIKTEFISFEKELLENRLL